MTPPTPRLMTRVYSGLRYAVTGAPPADWFGPAAPMTPEAPPSVAGRQFDYPVAVNWADDSTRKSRFWQSLYASIDGKYATRQRRFRTLLVGQI